MDSFSAIIANASATQSVIAVIQRGVMAWGKTSGPVVLDIVVVRYIVQPVNLTVCPALS